MFKKSAGLLIILIANILLVSHSILPHQHEGGFVTLHPAHSPDTSRPIDSHADDNDHQHNDKDTHQECLLQQSYLLSVNTSRLDFALAEEVNLLVAFLPAVFNQESYTNTTFLYKVTDPPPLLHSHYTFLVTHLFGLRAPPTV